MRPTRLNKHINPVAWIQMQLQLHLIAYRLGPALQLMCLLQQSHRGIAWACALFMQAGTDIHAIATDRKGIIRQYEHGLLQQSGSQRLWRPHILRLVVH